MTREAKKAAKQEKKLKILLGGYQVNTSVQHGLTNGCLFMPVLQTNFACLPSKKGTPFCQTIAKYLSMI